MLRNNVIPIGSFTSGSVADDLSAVHPSLRWLQFRGFRTYGLSIAK